MPKLPRSMPVWGMLLSLCWLHVVTVQAQSSVPTGAAPRASTGASQGQGAPAYRSAVERAVAAYGAGDFALAREQFERAHQVYPNARTLRGLGMAELELRDAASAVVHLEQALASQALPLEGALREAAEASLLEARRQLTQGHATPSVAALPAPVEVAPGDGAAGDSARDSASETAHRAAASQPPTLAAPPQKRGRWRIAPWVVVGLGAGAAVAGGVLVGLAGKDKREVEGAARGAPWRQAEASHDRYPRRVASGAVLLGVGALGIASGLTWRWRSRASERDVQVTIVGRGVGVSGRF